MKEPLILICNDDGIDALGMQTLAATLREKGNVWIVAPDREQSATSNSISLHKPLRVVQHGEQEFAVDGTPTDCVYVALHHLLPQAPHVVVSGINHGANIGSDVLYSGTVAAAMEGALNGQPAIAVSLCMPDDHNRGLMSAKQFQPAADYVAGLLGSVLQQPQWPHGMLLNINVPFKSRDELNGARVCTLGTSHWQHSVEMRHDPRGRDYYWIGGQRLGHDERPGTDVAAIFRNEISVTPLHFDLTSRPHLDLAASLQSEGFEALPPE